MVGFGQLCEKKYFVIQTLVVEEEGGIIDENKFDGFFLVGGGTKQDS